MELDEEEDDDRKDPIVCDNDSEDEDDSSENDNDRGLVTRLCSDIKTYSIKEKNTPTRTSSVVSPPTDEEDMVEDGAYKWYNKFKTTVCHMFVCHSRVDYVKNERCPSEVYLQKYLPQYGNAFEITIKDSKFFITTKLLQLCKMDSVWHPSKPIIRHLDARLTARILNTRMRDGYTLQHHLIESMFYVLLIGVSPRDVDAVKARITSNKSQERCLSVQSKYNWRSEERKLKVDMEEKNNEPAVCNGRNIGKLFELLFKNDTIPTFETDLSLDHSLYYQSFLQNINRLKKHATEYQDRVSGVRLQTKDLATILYKHDKFNELQDLKKEIGTEKDVEDFIRYSMRHPKGDVVFNLRCRDTNTQRYRINCLRVDSEHVWINSMVFSDVHALNLEGLIQKHRWGTHHILYFDYMYNSMLAKLHAEVTKLVIRYVLSKRPFDWLEDDCKKATKLHYKKIVYGGNNLPLVKKDSP